MFVYFDPKSDNFSVENPVIGLLYHYKRQACWSFGGGSYYLDNFDNKLKK